MTSTPSAKTGSRATTTSGTGRVPAGDGAFTLVEIIVAISVVAILTGLALPAIESVQRERLAREPVNRLALLAREVRGRAMAEGRPYQIVVDASGFRASRFLRPYGGLEEASEMRLALAQMEEREALAEAARKRGIETGPELPPDPREELVREGLRYFEDYTFPDGLRASLRFWNDTEWLPLEGNEFRRWIFQPSGMCEPLRFRAEADTSFFEVEFHPLTADIRSERSWVE